MLVKTEFCEIEPFLGKEIKATNGNKIRKNGCG